jgi:hypothetical protein
MKIPYNKVLERRRKLNPVIFGFACSTLGVPAAAIYAYYLRSWKVLFYYGIVFAVVIGFCAAALAFNNDNFISLATLISIPASFQYAFLMTRNLKRSSRELPETEHKLKI